MSKLNLVSVPKQIARYMSKKAPELLTGVGIGLGVCTVGLAVKATPKALMLAEEKKRQINKDILEEAKTNGQPICEHIDTLKPLDLVKTTWKCYIPAAVTGVASVVCLVGASSTNARRNAALAAAYTISESALKDYKEKVVEVVGEKKEKDIRDAVAKSKIEKDPVENKEIYLTDKGETRCYDVLSGRYFKSDIDALNKAVNELNRRMINQNYISLNEFYYEIGLDGNKIGNDIGWRIDNGLIELDFSAQLSNDGVPCLVMDFIEAPKYDFDRWI